MKNESTAINFDQEADMLYPTLNKVEELLKEYQMVPVFYEVLADYMTPIRMFQALRKEGTPCFMLESVENKDQWGRYSFIGINPKSEIKISGKELEVDGVKQEEEFKMSYLSDLIKKYKSPVMEDYPKLTGGLIGYFGYDMIRQVEKKLTNVPEDDLKMPECHLCMYDEIIAFDHLANKAVIIQNIHKGDNIKQKYEELEDKAELILHKMERPVSLSKDRFTLAKAEVTSNLTKEQYEANVHTRKGSDAVVEFAVKLPGRDDIREYVYLPIDAKFPKDIYEQLLDAYDNADPQAIETAGKLLETTIKKMAKDISDKYLAPPATTDFGIMFLPFEGIYAEVVRRSALLDELQRTYKVVVTGPTTLAAILNSLQMGFRTLAIQKHSGEVWTILGAVKKEFEKVGGMLEKAQKNLQTASGQIEEVLGTRTRAIQRKLKDVDTLSGREARAIIPELGPLTEEEEES